MEDEVQYGPEDRRMVIPEDAENPLFAYQYQYPLGTVAVVLAGSVLEAVVSLNERGIEPFSVTRVGVVMG
ncbi:MAG: hypothetical protein ACYDBI_06025 [Thermoplasmataceae archaeon]